MPLNSYTICVPIDEALQFISNKLAEQSVLLPYLFIQVALGVGQDLVSDAKNSFTCEAAA
jgi:hypothetical protein